MFWFYIDVFLINSIKLKLKKMKQVVVISPSIEIELVFAFIIVCAIICTIPGNRNESVFPLPVYAIPMRSLPERATGQA